VVQHVHGPPLSAPPHHLRCPIAARIGGPARVATPLLEHLLHRPQPQGNQGLDESDQGVQVFPFRLRLPPAPCPFPPTRSTLRMGAASFRGGLVLPLIPFPHRERCSLGFSTSYGAAPWRGHSGQVNPGSGSRCFPETSSAPRRTASLRPGEPRRGTQRGVAVNPASIVHFRNRKRGLLHAQDPEV